MQYLFYKGPEKKGIWRALDEPTLALRIPKAPRIAFTTILSVSEKPGKSEAVSDDALYQGPFYIDIDNDKEKTQELNIKKSIKTAQKVVKKLLKNKVKPDQIRVWASGKKGFHIMIPMHVFTKDVPLRKLPLTYKYMLGSMKLLDIVDSTVYSHGRGRMWRVENKQRLDNNAFKVGITVDELMELTPERYEQLCSAPREPIPLAPDGEKNGYLSALFNLAHQKALAAIKPIQVYIDPEIVEGLHGDFPPCAEAMSKGENLDPDKGYNEISTQFGKAVATFKPDNADEVVTAFANTIEGDSYDTPEKRHEHTMKAYRISARSKDYAWSCRSMLSVLKDKESPCLECPISFLLIQQDDLIAEAEAERETKRASDNAAIKQRNKDKLQRTGTVALRRNGDATNATHATNGSGIAGVSDFGGTRIERASVSSEKRNTEGAAHNEAEAGNVRESEADADARDSDTAEDQEFNDAVADITDESGFGGVAATPAGTGDPDDDDEGKFNVNNNAEGFTENPEGYGFINGEGDLRRISNFILDFDSIFFERIENLGEERRTAVSASVLINKKRVGYVIIEEQAWSSKASFISFFSGISNAGFYGKDDDVQRMKIVLMRDIEERAMAIRRVTSIGIHRQRVAETDVFTYVEPGFSFNTLGENNTYQVAGQIPCAPKLQHNTGITNKRETQNALYALTKINSDIKIAQIIGWYCACFLKQHIHAAYGQFPLLGFSGPAGAGKTNQATIVACLHGVDYRENSSPVSLPQASQFAVWKAIRDSMTIPRIMEEYNKSKLPRTFITFGEIFKDCWNQFSVQRGTLSNSKKHGDNQIGAHVTEFPLSAPVVVLSEQAVMMPALVERMIQISFTKQDLDIPGARDAFEFCTQNKQYYNDFARSANNLAVMVTVAQVRELIEANKLLVPREVGDRPQFSWAVVIAGLDFFEQICSNAGLDMENRIAELRNSLFYMLKSDATILAMVKQRSEVDIVMEKFATMAAMSDSEGSIPWLLEHVHYMRVDDYLYLDGLVAHAQYRSFCHRVDNALPVIDEFNQFKTLLRSEAYAEDLAAYIPGFARDRAVFKLSLSKMAEKGIEIAAFVGS